MQCTEVHTVNYVQSSMYSAVQCSAVQCSAVPGAVPRQKLASQVAAAAAAEPGQVKVVLR